MEDLQNSSDKHHCRCFRINPNDIEICKTKLVKLGFEPQIAEVNNGQIFGLRKRLFEILQIHFKVMPNGVIESEMEPPPEYPGAHLNQIHSYPSHDGLSVLLDFIKIRYDIMQPIPQSCHLPTIIDPNKPLKWWHLLIIGLAAVGLGYLILQALKE